MSNDKPNFPAERGTRDAAPGITADPSLARLFPTSPEPGAAPSPEIAPWVSMLAPERIEAELSDLWNDSRDWVEITDRLDLADEADATGEDDPARALLVAMLHLSDAQRFDLSMRHPVEVFGVASLAASLYGATNTDELADAADMAREVFLHPRVDAALGWIIDNQRAEFARALQVSEV